MQTTVYARTGSLAARELNISRRSPSFVESSDQKIFDLGLALFQRPCPRVGVVGLGGKQVDFALYVAQSFGVVTYTCRDFSLVGPERVHRCKDGSVVGLICLQSRDPRLKLFQRRHRLILSRRSAVVLRRSDEMNARVVVGGATTPSRMDGGTERCGRRPRKIASLFSRG
jgi:hypothetical protein